MHITQVPPAREIRNSADDGVVQNARDFPRTFYVRHMKSGPAAYQKETIMVDDDAIKAMLPTFKGKPVYMNHRNVDLDTMKEEACGYVTRSFWNEVDGWGWSEVLIIDDEAVDVIENGGWSASNAYVPTATEGGGTNHNVPYDRRILNGQFTHLALVPNPRYEDAKIFTPEGFNAYQTEKRQEIAEIQNSKDKKGSVMLNIFKTERKEVSEVEAGASVEFTNSKGEKVTATVEEMINAVEKAQVKPATVKVAGKEMTVEQLAKAFEATLTNSNDGETAEAKAAREAAEAKAAQEAADAAKAAEAAKAEELQNAANNFAALENAKPAAQPGQVIETEATRLQRGQDRYGSSK